MDANLNYHLLFTLPGAEDYPFSDILHFSVIRMPLIKQASFAIIRLNITPIVYVQTTHDIGDNTFPKVGVRIDLIDTTENNKTIQTIFEQQYNIISAKALTSIHGEEQNIVAEFILCNPIILKMDSSLVYNPIHQNMTTMDMIRDYEEFITKKYGDTFESKHILSNPSSHIYEQVLVKPFYEDVRVVNEGMMKHNFFTDLDVPAYLIYKYKPTLPYSFYFFDDFNLNNNTSKSITRFFLSLYDLSKFEQFDVTEYGDIFNNNKLLKTTEIGDQFKTLDKASPVITFKDKHGIYNTVKIPNGVLEQQKIDDISEIEIEENRKVHKYKTSFQNKAVGQSTEFLNVYVPDNLLNALDRVGHMLIVLKEKIDYCVTYQSMKCSYDWLQFGKSYNMSTNTPGDFLFTPIGIWNVFRRIDAKQEFLEHHCKFQMVKFKK